MRLIDADKLRLSCWVYPTTSRVSTEDYDYFYSKADVDDAPTVDAEPIRHGHWIPIYLCETHIYKCSYCHTPFFALVDRYHYCPNCGAKMDVEEMKTCDKCQYCYEQSNHHKGEEIHTIHCRCHLIEKAVNPYNSCEMWKERKGKMEIRYKDGYVDEVEEDS